MQFTTQFTKWLATKLVTERHSKVLIRDFLVNKTIEKRAGFSLPFWLFNNIICPYIPKQPVGYRGSNMGAISRVERLPHNKW